MNTSNAQGTTSNLTINSMITKLNAGAAESGNALDEALNSMNKKGGDGTVGPEKLLEVQRATSIWTTYISQVTSMGKAVTDASKSIVRNYN